MNAKRHAIYLLLYCVAILLCVLCIGFCFAKIITKDFGAAFLMLTCGFLNYGSIHIWRREWLASHNNSECQE